MYTTRELLTQHRARGTAEKIAVVDGERRISYADLIGLASRYGALLQRSGVRKGDRVCLFLPRSIEAIATLFGTWFAGAVAVVIHDGLRARQVEYILEHSEASCLVTETAQLRHAGTAISTNRSVLNIDDAMIEGAVAAERVIAADLAAITYTSGSTGMPKGVMVSHDNLVSGAKIVVDYLGLTADDVILSVLPFSFDYGLNQLLTAFLMGATLVVQRSLFPPDICNTMARERVTGLAGVPMLWLQLTGRLSPFPKRSFPRLRYITNSGGRLPEHTVRLIRTVHPHVRVFLMYGLTEAFRSTFLPPEEVDRRPSSMGKAIPNVEVLVVNAEGLPCKAGEVGELVHRGANISLGYWRDVESTRRVFRPHPFQSSTNGREELVVFSGDLVKSDDEGYLYFVGRRDQQIKTRGFRVSPEEVERCIASSNLVAGAVAFAVAADGDDHIGLAVIPREASTFRADVLDEFCRREMPEYMRPRAIWSVSEFPLTSTGKADRPKVRQLCCPAS